MKKAIISLSVTVLLMVCPNLYLHAQPRTQGQNLLYNPSFEEYTDCPKKIDAHGVLTIVDAWFQPTAGSADYYNVCGAKDCGVPNNKLGVQHAHSGLGYCGIYCSKTDYREYLQTRLKEPLRAGETYQLSFYVSLSEYSSGSVATLGGLVSVDRPSDTVQSLLMKKSRTQIAPGIWQTTSTLYAPQVVNPYERVLTDTYGWSCISGTFVAEGGEEYLTIGNFLPAAQSNVTDLDYITYLLPGAYYYIDDISLVCLTCDEHTASSVDTLEQELGASNAAAPTYKVGDSFILKDIFFDFDKSVLLQQSYIELLHLIEILKTHPKMKIEISGHTDGRGSDEYNQKLSESRAKAVVDYLILKGIEPGRLSYKGYGKLRPIADNTTDEGRAANRRVEFKILAM